MDETSARPAVFNPTAVASINRAYEEALNRLGAEALQSETRARLAENMMLFARKGETNEERLCALALIRTLGRKPDDVTLYSGL